MGKTGKRLSKEKWEEIRLLLLESNSITRIAKEYKISRHTIYSYAWRHGWLEKKQIESPRTEPKRSFWTVLWESLVGKPHRSFLTKENKRSED